MDWVNKLIKLIIILVLMDNWQFIKLIVVKDKI